MLIAVLRQRAGLPGGTYLSFYLDTSTGGAIVAVLTLQFIAAYALARLRRGGPVAARA